MTSARLVLVPFLVAGSCDVHGRRFDAAFLKCIAGINTGELLFDGSTLWLRSATASPSAQPVGYPAETEEAHASQSGTSIARAYESIA